MGIAEILTKSLFNTLLGMGTVFSVLIFISFIISLLKYLPVFLERFQVKKTKGETNEGSSAEMVVPEPLHEDPHVMVAVITAALTASKASQGPSGDGYFVRSIKRI